MSGIPMVKSRASAQTRSAWFPNEDQSRNQRPVLVAGFHTASTVSGPPFRPKITDLNDRYWDKQTSTSYLGNQCNKPVSDQRNQEKD
jgi:hypothetical protein